MYSQNLTKATQWRDEDKRAQSECVCVCLWANIDSEYTVFFSPIQTHRQLKDLVRASVSLTTRQQFGKNPRSSQPQRPQKPKHSQMCVYTCVLVCMSAALLTAHFTFLWMETQTWRCHIFLSGRISFPLSPRSGWKKLKRRAELFLCLGSRSAEAHHRLYKADFVSHVFCGF